MGVWDRDYMRSPSRRGMKLLSGIPAVTLIVGICVGVYLIQFVCDFVIWTDWEQAGVGEGHVQFFLSYYMGLSIDGILHGRLWQFVTHMFVHGNFLHILFNSAMTFIIGRAVVQLLGERHFLGVFFLGGVVGGIAQLLFTLMAGPADSVLIGASGGAYALLIAFCTMMPDLRLTMIFPIPITLRARYLAVGVVAVSVIWFLLDLGAGGGTIGHMAHLGGAFAGWFYVRLLGHGQAMTLDRLQRERARREARGRRRREGRTVVKPAGFLGKRQRSKVLDADEPGDEFEEDFVSRELDPILDKISREGFQSLTPKERRILEQGSKRIT